MDKKHKISLIIAVCVLAVYYLFLGAFQIAGIQGCKGFFVIEEIMGTSIEDTDRCVYQVSLQTENSFLKNSILFDTVVYQFPNSIDSIRFSYIPHNLGLDCRLCSANKFPVEDSGHNVGYIETREQFFVDDKIDDVQFKLRVKTSWWLYGLVCLLLGGFLAEIYFFLESKVAKKKPRLSIAFALLLVVVCQLALYLMLGHEKEIYHCDEIFSYRLSNDFNYTDGNRKLDAQEYFLDKTTVRAGEENSFDKVYTNQVNDVHPPLYYFIFHAASSLFPGQFSKWIGLSINILFAILSSFVLYGICNTLFKNKMLSFITVTFSALSIGMAGSVLFLRMYSMLTFWTLCYVGLNILIIQYKELKSHFIVFLGLFLVSFFGFLTHYYFIVFAGFLSVCVFVYLIIKNIKKEKHPLSTVFYTLSIIAGFITSVFYYPAAIQHIFFSYRGVQTYTFNIQEKYQNFLEYLQIVASDFFISLPVAIVLLFGVIVVFFIPKVRKNIVSHCKNSKFIVLALLCVLFIVTISFVAPYQTDRYILCLYPVIAMLIIYVLNAIFSSFDYKHDWVLTSVVAFSLMSFTYVCNPIEYKYTDNSNVIHSDLAPYKDSLIIVLTDQEWKLNTIMTDIAEFEDFIYVIGENNMYSEMKKLLSNYTGDTIVYYVDNAFFDQAKNIRFVKKTSGLGNHMKLFSHEFFNSYVVFE